MKPAKFAYYDPTTLDEALALMAQFGDQARPLAGGQSLVPLMNFRLVRPAHLIDLNGVGELSYLRADDGTLRIGAITRQRELERSAEVAEGWPLLREAAHARMRMTEPTSTEAVSDSFRPPRRVAAPGRQ